MVEEPPLVIDLDGTLLRSDLLIETGLVFLRDEPHRLLASLQWLARGKAALKQELAHATEIDVSVLPYDKAVLEFIENERKRGRRVVLATASHRRLADQVAGHLGLFDQVIATDGDRNLSAHAKRDAALGAASGYMAVMVLALYINDARTTQLYRHQEFIWLACPLLLTWISRVWMLAHRGVMNEDPVIFAMRDRASLAVGALMALVIWAAT